MTARPTAKKVKSLRLMWIFPLAALIMAQGTLLAYGQYVRNKPPTRNECIILLHGLYRSAASMALIEHHLIQNGYAVINIDYASTFSP
jgi:alpha-beta hydrolase superfamily lysophospholipase